MITKSLSHLQLEHFRAIYPSYAGFIHLKAAAKGAISFLPEPFRDGAKRAKDLLKGMAVGGTMFEALGFSYIGPIDGHDLDQLLPVLRTVKQRATGPILLHIITKKGRGFAPAENAHDKGHATAQFDLVTGRQEKGNSNAISYTAAFSNALVLRLTILKYGNYCSNARWSGLKMFSERYPLDALTLELLVNMQ